MHHDATGDGAVPDWREDISRALDDWVRAAGGLTQAPRLVCVGPAEPTGRPGWWAVRDAPVNLDQSEGFRLSGPDGPAAGPFYPVMEAAAVGTVLRVRVAEFASLADAYLWQDRLPGSYLPARLREALAALPPAGLAADLAAGRLTPLPGFDPEPELDSPLGPAREQARAACLAPGVRLVHGPPAAVAPALAAAAAALLADGRRVLLATASGRDADSALLSVIAAGHHHAGSAVRVGTPQHPGMLRHPEACLPHLVREQVPDDEERRQAIERRLVVLREEADDLARLQEAVAGFDPAQYRQAERRLAAAAAIPGLARAVATAAAHVRRREREAEQRRREHEVAQRRVARLEAARSALAEMDQIQADLDEEQAVAAELSARALAARHEATRISRKVARLDAGVVPRVMTRRLRAGRDAARAEADRLAGLAATTVGYCDERQKAAAVHLSDLSARAGCTRADLDAADEALATARYRVNQAADDLALAQDLLGSRQQELQTARDTPAPTAEQHAMVADPAARELLAVAEMAAALAARIAAAQPDRARLEREHARLQQRFDHHHREAEEADIIRRSKIVATTLAGLGTSAVLRGSRYDVVLVAGAGAATLPELLLAVSLASTTAVLFGEFRAPGPPPDPVDPATPAVRRWLRADVFAHCGIHTAGDARDHPGCVELGGLPPTVPPHPVGSHHPGRHLR
jgi:hypothetical protein